MPAQFKEESQRGISVLANKDVVMLFVIKINEIIIKSWFKPSFNKFFLFVILVPSFFDINTYKNKLYNLVKQQKNKTPRKAINKPAH